MSIATVSVLRNYTVPVVGENLGIEIIHGRYDLTDPDPHILLFLRFSVNRHPLQELFVESFIPNQTLLGGDQGRINIITGPNMSGKSVYLKQVKFS